MSIEFHNPMDEDDFHYNDNMDDMNDMDDEDGMNSPGLLGLDIKNIKIGKI